MTEFFHTPAVVAYLGVFALLAICIIAVKVEDFKRKRRDEQESVDSI